MACTNSGRVDYGRLDNNLYNRIFKDAVAIAQISELPPDDTIALARNITGMVFDAACRGQAKAAMSPDQEEPKVL
jgi:hypothetical protein